MQTFVRILIQAGVIVSLVACGSIPTVPPTAMPIAAVTPIPTPCEGPAITLSDIDDTITEVRESLGPLADYLAERLAPYGIKCGAVKGATTVNEMIALFESGEIDIYFDSIYPAFLVSEATGGEPILRQWRNCDPEYYSVILSRADSGITSIEDLPGHMIAMDRPDSTSGLALPAVYLIEHGLKLVVKRPYYEPVAAEEVGIFFTLDDVNSLMGMLSGNVDAMATDDYYYSKFVSEYPGKLILLAQTVSMPRRAVVVRAGLPNDLKAAIKNELLQAESNQEGKAAIGIFEETCKFDDVPGEIEAAFSQMRAMHEEIKAIPGWQEAFEEAQATPTPGK